MRKGRLHDVLGLLVVASMLAVAVPAWAQTATTLPSTTVTTGFTIGLDVNQPFTDKEAPSAPGKKILTSWVAVGNRLDDPLPFSLKDLKLEDAHGNVYTSTVKPIWTQPLEISVIGPHEVVGGYVSWEVPFYVWPTSVVFIPQGRGAGLGSGWAGVGFKDLDQGGLYHFDVGELKWRGMVAGYPDGNFYPFRPLLRQQFAKWIVLAAAPDGVADFSYPEGYLREAQAQALMNQGGSGSDLASRLEVAIGIAKLGQHHLKPTPDDYSLSFTDVPYSARPLLALLASNGVLAGTSATTFSPDAPCSRGQAAKLLARMLDPSPLAEGTVRQP